MRPQTLYDLGSRLGAEEGVKTASPAVPHTLGDAEPDGFAPGPSVRDADVPRVHVIVTPPAPVTGAARFATTGSYVPNATEEAEIWQLLETVTDTLRVAMALAPASWPASRRAALQP